MRWIAGSLVLVLLGCGPSELVVADDELGTETSETGSDGDHDELCQSALDPATYAEGPIVSPEPWVATPECPALPSPMILELPAVVEVTGMLLVDGMAWPGDVEFRGRSGEGEVEGEISELDGFHVELLPSRYDVYAALDGPLAEGHPRVASGRVRAERRARMGRRTTRRTAVAR